MYLCGIFIDLRKAFAMDHHSILLQKLNDYGTWDSEQVVCLLPSSSTTNNTKLIVIKTYPIRT